MQRSNGVNMQSATDGVKKPTCFWILRDFPHVEVEVVRTRQDVLWAKTEGEVRESSLPPAFSQTATRQETLNLRSFPSTRREKRHVETLSQRLKPSHGSNSSLWRRRDKSDRDTAPAPPPSRWFHLQPSHEGRFDRSSREVGVSLHFVLKGWRHVRRQAGQREDRGQRETWFL